MSKHQTRRTARLEIVLLVIILIVQLALCLYYGGAKSGFHEDEIATYLLSNSPDGIYTYWKVGRWCTGEEYRNSFFLNGQTRFSYGMVFENQKNDVHPPLYYMVIHTLSSLVPDVFSKWIGILPNIVFSLLTTILVWMLSLKISRSNAVSLSCAGFYALSVGTLSTVVFIRMYAMLTFFCTLLVFLHIRLAYRLNEQGKMTVADALALLICTAAGILTQYYFLIFCFFVCGCFAIGLLLAKKWKQLVLYVAAEFGAIAVAWLIFPTMIFHIFGSYRGTEALSNAVDPGALAEKYRTVASIISEQLCNGWGMEICVVLLCIAVLLPIKRGYVRFKTHVSEGMLNISCQIRVSEQKNRTGIVSMKGAVYLVLSVAVLGYILVVARIAPFLVDRYYMPIYPLICLILTHLLFALACRLWKEGNAIFIAAAVLCLICTMGHRDQNVNFLYEDQASRTTLDEYSDFPVIILNGTYDWYPEHWDYECYKHPAIFRTEPYCDLSVISEAVSTYDLSGGFLIYSCRVGLEEEELFSELCKYVDIRHHEQLVSAGDPVYLCYLS